MIGSNPQKQQRDIFRPFLIDFIDTSHEFVLLANRIDWNHFETRFAPLYSHTGQPAMPIRLMVGSLLLKHLYNLGDETLVKEWVMNPYMQYFCGRAHFEHVFPCDPSDFVHFRKRIGVDGVHAIFTHTVELHGHKSKTGQVLSDTTVQENFTTFPTDAKLAKKVIDECAKIAHENGLEQRQSYRRISKQLVRETYNATHPKRAGRARKAVKKLRTLAGRVVRELERLLPEHALERLRTKLELYKRAITQQRHDKDKVYSLHKPETACIAKGKSGKPYEFGNKVGLVTTVKTGIILAIKVFIGNPHDSKTIEPLLEQIQQSQHWLPQELIYDRGGKGASHILDVKITTPTKPKKTDSAYTKRKTRAKFNMRAGIEPIIGHLKTDFRMGQNYLHGEHAAQMNAFLAASAWNLKKLMKELKQNFLLFISKLFFNLFYPSIRSLKLGW